MLQNQRTFFIFSHCYTKLYCAKPDPNWAWLFSLTKEYFSTLKPGVSVYVRLIIWFFEDV